MSNAKTAETSQYIDNYEHDDLFNAKQVTDVGSDKQTLIDEAVAGTTYIGSGARGLATNADGWLLTKIVEAGTDTTIQHAIGAWTLRDDVGTVYS
jgi:hypothetical protein